MSTGRQDAMSKNTDNPEELLNNLKKLNPVTKYNAVEIEISGNRDALRDAIIRLRTSDKPMKALVVLDDRLEDAKYMLKTLAAPATLINMSGTRREYVGIENSNDSKN
jgi:hypothetical protein